MRRPESPSSIDLYHNCPLAYKLRYVTCAPAADSPYLELGRTFHELAAEYAKHCLQSGLRTDLDWLRELAHEKASALPFQLRGELHKLSEALGYTFMLPDGAETYLIEDKLGVTEDFEPCDFSDPKCMLRGITDFAIVRRDYIYLVDYKTTYKVPPASEVPIQAAAYAALLGAVYRGKPIKTCFLYVRYGVERNWTFEPEMLPEMASYFKKLITRMHSSEDYPARISSFCDRCPYAYCCPELERYAQNSNLPEGPLTTEQAQELAKEYKALSIKMKLIEEKLRSYCEQWGPVVVEDEVLGYELKQVRSVPDPRAVIELLGKAGVPKERLWQLLTLPVSKLDSLLKELQSPEVREDVLQHIKVESRTEFRWIKLKEV